MKHKNRIKSYRSTLDFYSKALKYYKYAVSNYKCNRYKPYLMYYIYMIGDLQEDIKRIKMNLNKRNDIKK